MYTPKKETPQPGQAWGVGQHKDDTGNYASPASTLIAEADAIATSIPYMMTRERKRSAVSRFLGLWLQALAVSREGTV